MANLRFSKYQLRVNNPDGISDIDALEPVQSQYAASPRITSLLVRQAALLDPGRDVMAWYDGIFNPRTAEGVGLDIWGRIVGIGRMLWAQNTEFFGFCLLFEEDHGPGSCFVLETGVMEIKAVLLFELTSYEVSLLRAYGLLNRPAGVGFSWLQVNPASVFGFAGQGLQPFNQGTFTPYIEQSPA